MALGQEQFSEITAEFAKKKKKKNFLGPIMNYAARFILDWLFFLLWYHVY